MTNYIRPLFDIQRVYIDGKSFYYEVFYKVGQSFQQVTSEKFASLKDAERYIDTLMNESEV